MRCARRGERRAPGCRRGFLLLEPGVLLHQRLLAFLRKALSQLPGMSRDLTAAMLTLAHLLLLKQERKSEGQLKQKIEVGSYAFSLRERGRQRSRSLLNRAPEVNSGTRRQRRAPYVRQRLALQIGR